MFIVGLSMSINMVLCVGRWSDLMLKVSGDQFAECIVATCTAASKYEQNMESDYKITLTCEKSNEILIHWRGVGKNP